MSSLVRGHAYPKALSQALLTLGGIRAVETPIISGLIGFYKAKDKEGSARDQEMYRHLKLFKDFCTKYETIVSYEIANNSEELEKWLTQKNKDESISKIETYVAIITFFEDDTKRNENLTKIKTLCRVAEDILEGNINTNDVEQSLFNLEIIKKKLEERLEPEKKTSEKILTGRTLIV